MKREMRRCFVLAYYSRDLHLRLKRLVQGDRSIDAYFQEMEMCLLRTGITEDEESTMARFLVGLNKPNADKVHMTSYTNLTELVHFAKRAEPQLADFIIRVVSHFPLIIVILHGATNNSKGLGCTHLLPLLLHLVQLLVQFQVLQNKLMQKAKL